MITRLEQLLIQNKTVLCPVIQFNSSTQKLLQLNFTNTNTQLTPSIINHTFSFCNYINNLLAAHNATFGIGGYNEHRTIYSRSEVFTEKDEPRTLHLGIDIWGKEGTKIFAPLGGIVHSVGFNNAYGDYGATIILQHQLQGLVFYTLYGHVSFKDIEQMPIGKYFAGGELLAHFGKPNENGNWPPHLHFQIIEDLQGKVGDYFGVCKYSQKEKYLANCPNADLILQLMQFVSQ